MQIRRIGLITAGALAAAGLVAVGGVRATAPQDSATVTVYKSPT
jgi:hypothetical protein